MCTEGILVVQYEPQLYQRTSHSHYLFFWPIRDRQKFHFEKRSIIKVKHELMRRLRWRIKRRTNLSGAGCQHPLPAWCVSMRACAFVFCVVKLSSVPLKTRFGTRHQCPRPCKSWFSGRRGCEKSLRLPIKHCWSRTAVVSLLKKKLSPGR